MNASGRTVQTALLFLHGRGDTRSSVRAIRDAGGSLPLEKASRSLSTIARRSTPILSCWGLYSETKRLSGGTILRKAATQGDNGRGRHRTDSNPLREVM